MHIAYDAAPLVRKQKGGVGFAQADAILTLSRSHVQDRFSLLYFSLRTPKKKRAYLAPYLRKNVDLVSCPFYTGRFYRATYGLIPLPFSLFFPRRADVTHFFDFLIPPGVRGKKVVSVPDTGYLHYPESLTVVKRVFLKWNMRSSLARADRIITASDYMKRELVEYYGIDPARVRVIKNSVDRIRFRPDLDCAKIAHICEKYGTGSDYILFMGALEPRKNLARLIDAYADLIQLLGDATPKLVIAGRRSFGFENLEKKVERRGLSSRVSFCGFVAEKDKPYLLAGARCFVFPSLSEGSGAPVLEAMACGTAVLASRAGALPEICGDAALYVDPLSTVQIRDGLCQLVTDEALREDYASRACLRAGQDCFDRAENAEALYRVYRELCP